MKGLSPRGLLKVCLLIYLAGPGTADGCPAGWMSGNKKCYLIHTDVTDHSTAVTQCNMYNASLVSITSNEEWNYLLSLLQPGDSGEYWLGLQRSDSGVYTWDNGQPYSKSNIRWMAGTEGYGYQKGTSQCAILNITAGLKSSSGEVSYQACTEKHVTVCQRPSDLPYVTLCDMDDGWRDFGSACYKPSTATLTWYDAEAECQRQNSHLFVPTSDYDHDNTLPQLKVAGPAWIGISDTVEEGILTTVTGGRPSQSWAQGHDDLPIPGQTCVMATVTSTGSVSYTTSDCHNEVGFVCQRRLGSCPQGWDEHGTQCYQLQTTQAQYTTWFLAKQFCRDEGAEILIIKSMEEHDFLTQKLSRDGVGNVWLGFSDEVTADTLQWADGTPATGTGVFGVWMPSFPRPQANRLDCGILQIGNGNGSWSNGYCFSARGFVCEIPITQSLRPKVPGPANYSCEDDMWLLYGNQCFYLDDYEASWDLAQEGCLGLNAHLATVSDITIQSFLGLKLQTTSWIGLRLDRHDMKYYWTDASPANFTNYLPGKPSGANQGLDCIEMFAGGLEYTGGWLDQNCSKNRDYICQKPAAQSGSQAVPSVVPWSDRCDLNWILNPTIDVCYLMVVDAPKTWVTASYDCLRRGGNLLSISGPGEQTRVAAMLSTLYPNYQDPFWIGAADGNQDGGWDWTDGAPFRYLNWHAGEPSGPASTEHCVEMRVQWQYGWNDQNCDNYLNYICKKQAKAPAEVIPTAPTAPSYPSCVVQPIVSGQYSVQSQLSFSASSYSDDRHTPHDSRLLDSNKHAWRPALDQAGEWVGVFFYQTMLVAGIDIAGEVDTFNFVSSFTVQYQHDINSPWRWVENPPGTAQVFYGSMEPSVSTTILFVEPVQAQSIRLYPQSWGTHIAVRWELHGCVYDACQPEYTISGPLVVTDDGLTVSGMSDSDHDAFDARLQPIQPDTPPSCWRPPDDPPSPPWIQADLGTVKLLRGVAIAGNPNADEWVTSFQLQFHLNDGSENFTVYQEPYGTPMNFTGNRDNHTIETFLLKASVPVQQVRIVPLAAHNHIALRFDLLVCNIGCKDIALMSGKRNVSDSAFSASSTLGPRFSAHRSRLGEQFVGTSGGAWISRFYDNHQYIQVDLGEMVQITGVATQGSEHFSMWVRSYTLAFSQDGQNYNTYAGNGLVARIFEGNIDAVSVRKHYLDRPQVARYVQLWPVDYNRGMAVRWELYGCPGPNSGQAIGCYQDNPQSRDLPYEPLVDPLAGVWPTSCRSHCYEKGYYYAGLQNSSTCYCGDSYGRYGYTPSACTLRCQPPYDDQLCGGVVNNFIYDTGLSPMFKYCKTGWTPRGDNCYMVILEKANWFNSREVCQEVGGDLVAIGSKVDNDFIFSLLVASGAGSSAWIGLNDLQTTNFYQWADNSDVTFTGWDSGQPVADPQIVQHCVALNRETGGWRTTMCEDILFSVCWMAQMPSSIPHLPTVMNQCDLGWSGFQGSCYKLLTQSGAWNDSRQACLAFNASLIRIDDQFEEAFISSQLATFSGYFWTDAADTARSGEYSFSDNSGFVKFTKWGRGQPQGGSGHCVALRGGQYDGGWYNRNCTAKQDGAVCERPLPDYVAPPTPPVVPPGARCPDRWYEATYSCFQLNIQPERNGLTWDEAREDCQSQGADLASFHSRTDFDGLIESLVPGTPNNLWIGLFYDEEDGDLKWSDGSSVNFMLWKSGESGGAQQGETCVQVDVETGSMVHQFCYNKHSWLCAILRGAVPTPRTTVITPTPASPGSCSPRDDTWKRFGDSCYYVSTGAGDEARTWREARAWCLNKSADLVSITSQQEQLFLQTLINKVTAQTLWIGLSQLDLQHGVLLAETNSGELRKRLSVGLGRQTAIHLYTWSDGSPVAYENWDTSEPNDFGGSKLCVDIFPRNGRWSDENCALEMGFVCEDSLRGSHPVTGATVSLTGYCPSGFRSIGVKCFSLNGNGEGEQPKDWATARDYCKSLGPNYSLATVSSAAENDFLVTLLPEDGVATWVGLWRLTDGAFVWADNSEVIYTNWNIGEPDGGLDDCVYMRGTAQDAGLWSSAPCGLTANFICQTFIDSRVSTPEHIPNPCDAKQGFEPFQSGCYKYINQLMSWENAESFCQSFAASLPVVNDAYTQAFLQRFINRKSRASTTGAVPPTWLGLNDVMQTGKYSWSIPWPVTFTRWGLGEPSRSTGEGCVSMNADGFWGDDNCSKALPFVCVVINESPFLTPKPPSGQCVGVDYWISSDPFCYLFVTDDHVTFYDARMRCEALESTLVTIHDNATLKFLASMFSGQVWIGLISSDTEGFVWLDRSAVDFTSWADSQPSGTGQEGVPEHCVAMDPQTMTWDDKDCAARMGYICSKLQEVDNSILTPPPIASFTSVLVPTIVPQKTPTLPSRKPNTSPLQTGPATAGNQTTTPVVLSSVTTSTRRGATQFTHTPVHKPAQDQRGAGLSGGAIAGIVIAVILVAMCAVTGVYIYKRPTGCISLASIIPFRRLHGEHQNFSNFENPGFSDIESSEKDPYQLCSDD